MDKVQTLYEQVVQNSHKSYNVKEVSRLIILIKKGSNKAKINDYKYQLFLNLSKCVLKAVNNFFSICKKSGVPDQQIMHEDEDIVAECYLVLNNCLEKVNLKYTKMFYFYFNSGLNRAMFRVYKRNYEKYNGEHGKTIVNTDDNEKYVLDKVKHTHHFDTTSIDLAGFTPLEMLIIEHKMNKQKLKDFLKENKLPANQYYELWEGLQTKLFELYKNPETNKLEY